MAFYSLTPIQDLEIINSSDGSTHYRNESNDPYFYVNLSKSLTKGWYEIEIPIKCLKGSVKRSKIYFSLGQGYEESLSIPIPEIKDNKIIAIVAFPAEVKALRLDPTIAKSEFVIEKIKITKLSQFRAAKKLFVGFKKKTKRDTVPFLFKALKRSGLSGVREELRNANFFNIYSDDNSENLSYEQWLANEISESRSAFEKKTISKYGFDNEPLISVVVSTYNTPIKWLADCVGSVVNQTYKNWELCISDDASTNGAVKTALKNYAENDPRIKVFF